MPDFRTQTQLAQDLAEWQKQCVIAQLASDNGDMEMFFEAQRRISEIETRQRQAVPHA